MSTDSDTCVHQPAGLCPDCRAAFQEDEEAWLEYGHHAAGEARWREVQAEMARERAEQEAAPAGADDSEMPF